MANKETISTKFAKVIEILEQNKELELAQFIEERKAQHEKKSTTKNLTPTQKANEELFSAIVDFLVEDKGKYQIKQLAELVPLAKGLTVQKLSGVLSRKEKAGLIEKVTEKGVTYYKAIEVE